MSTLALVLVFAGAILTALYNVYTKRLQKNGWAHRSAVLVFFLQGGAALLLLLSSFFTGGPQLKPGFWQAVVVSGILNIGILYGTMRARALEDVSLVTPIATTTPAFVIFSSMILLGEYPSMQGKIGIGLLVVGTYLLNIQEAWKKLEERVGVRNWILVALAPFAMFRTSKGIRWAFFVVLLATVALNFDALIARRSNVGFGFACVFAIGAVGNAVIAWRSREWSTLPKVDVRLIGKMLTLAVLYAATNFLTNFAYRFSITPYVGALKRIQVPLTILFAYFLLGEKRSFRDRIIAGLLMALGAVFISLG